MADSNLVAGGSQMLWWMFRQRVSQLIRFGNWLNRQDSCAAPNAERSPQLAVRADLNTPLLSSNTDAEREAELTQLNGKLYTVVKAQFDKSCPGSQAAKTLTSLSARNPDNPASFGCIID